jgi:hypothetical protein
MSTDDFCTFGRFEPKSVPVNPIEPCMHMHQTLNLKWYDHGAPGHPLPSLLHFSPKMGFDSHPNPNPLSKSTTADHEVKIPAHVDWCLYSVVNNHTR